MRYLGLDIGRRRIGLSVGEIIASELTTLESPKDEDFYSPNGVNLASEQLRKIIKDEEVAALVAGLPVNEEGQPTEESALISDFCDQLKKTLNLPIYFIDETLTSFMAADMLEEQGLSKKEIEEREHQLAAQLILQEYLEEHENR